MPRKPVQPPQAKRREPSNEVWPLMDTFNNLGSEHGEERMPELLNEFLELVEHEAQRRSERMLEQAAISDRLRAVASRRK
jgi:hypothetical protein